MSNNKNEILKYVIAELKTAIGPNVFRTFKLLDQINDFPSLCLNITRDDRTFDESANLGGTFILTIRGYVYNEDSIGASDQLIEDVETVIKSLSLSLFDSMKVVSVVTDEGLFTPYGIIDVEILVDY
jgi:hypothetical protein